MIADIVEYCPGRQLLLTHTNAGVDALEKRLIKRKINKEKFTVKTIASYCIQWCRSYFNTAKIEQSSLTNYNDKYYYKKIYKGAREIFKTTWAADVLRSTYIGVIVDEYQDCVQLQHEIFLELNRFLHVIVLGDPLQGIFDFDDTLVDWGKLEFPIIDVKTEPWRWNESNPDLGNYLMKVREKLEPVLSGEPCTLRIPRDRKDVKIISFSNYKLTLPCNELSKYSKIIYIANVEEKQLLFCHNHSYPEFQVDEKQDCKELFDYAKKFDEESECTLVLSVIDFAKKCLTKVGAELDSYEKKMKMESFDFLLLKKHRDFGNLLIEHRNNDSRRTVLEILRWLTGKKEFRKFRSELLYEMIRSVRFAIEDNSTILDAANKIRRTDTLRIRYNFNYLSSRTLLSKGLEFDCVIIDMTSQLKAKDFYVAMTRATKKIYIISNTDTFSWKNKK